MLELVKRKAWKGLWRVAEEARWAWVEAPALKAAIFKALEVKQRTPQQAAGHVRAILIEI